MPIFVKSIVPFDDAQAAAERPRRRPLEISVSWVSLGRIILAIAVIGLLCLLGKLLQLVFLSTLLALALHQIVAAVTRRGGPRWVGIFVALLVVLAFVALVGLLVPGLVKQASTMVARLPELQKHLVTQLPGGGPLPDIANRFLQSASFSNPDVVMGKFVTGAGTALEVVSDFLVMLVISVYLLVDGCRIFQWLLAFLPRSQRSKCREASPEIARIVSRFIVGQFITSVLAGSYAFAVLSLLHVPNAILLGLVAAIFDILPILGFFLFVIPAVGMAFTVSPMTAGAVALCYGAYHLLEAYFIVPKVYGEQLKLSTLTVLLSCMAGWLLAGPVGAIAILPVVASYPVVEKIWLARLLQSDTVEKHDALEGES